MTTSDAIADIHRIRHAYALQYELRRAAETMPPLMFGLGVAVGLVLAHLWGMMP